LTLRLAPWEGILSSAGEAGFGLPGVRSDAAVGAITRDDGVMP